MGPSACLFELEVLESYHAFVTGRPAHETIEGSNIFVTGVNYDGFVVSVNCRCDELDF